MKIRALEIENVRGFKKLDKTEFSDTINIIVGANNSGKSTIIHSLFKLQRRSLINKQDITIGQTKGHIKIFTEGFHHPQIKQGEEFDHLFFDISTNTGSKIKSNKGKVGLAAIPETEPGNLIYPYLSKRKVTKYQVQINEANANSVTGNFTNLYSKIDRLITPQFQPANSEYIAACDEILGFQISTLPKGAGKEAVLFVHNLEHIPLSSMGEGISNMLGLITDLCIAENKIFLIEEPENDIHPKALKSLLNLIADKSKNNQFFISTHSNIVLKQLGGYLDSKVFKVSNIESDKAKPGLKYSKLEEVAKKPESRKEILEELGYEFYDFDLWNSWLFLEESSAEVIIRQHLIRWFTPSLVNKIKTFSANSISQIAQKFQDFNRLFVFLHLQPIYKNKVWVIIDGGDEEKKIIDEFRSKYTKSGWKVDNFSQFKEHDFEKYYPSQFQKEVEEILAISNKKEKRERKILLTDKVKDWILNNEETAKSQFAKSAEEVIKKLKSIESELNKSM